MTRADTLLKLLDARDRVSGMECANVSSQHPEHRRAKKHLKRAKAEYNEAHRIPVPVGAI